MDQTQLLSLLGHSTSALPVLWRCVVTDPASAVTLLSGDTNVLYVNRQAARNFGGPDADPDHYIGHNLADFAEPAFFNERQEIFHQVLADGRPRLLRSIFLGYQHVNWINRLAPPSTPPSPRPRKVPPRDRPGTLSDPFDHGVLMSIGRRVAGYDLSELVADQDIEYVETEVISLGPLGVLTRRELEVLALLGRGMSIKQIALGLNRSPRTVEKHREAMGAKLNLSDRLELAEIAQRAGLRVEDADRKSVRFDRRPLQPARS